MTSSLDKKYAYFQQKKELGALFPQFLHGKAHHEMGNGMPRRNKFSYDPKACLLISPDSPYVPLFGIDQDLGDIRKLAEEKFPDQRRRKPFAQIAEIADEDI